MDEWHPSQDGWETSGGTYLEADHRLIGVVLNNGHQ